MRHPRKLYVSRRVFVGIMNEKIKLKNFEEKLEQGVKLILLLLANQWESIILLKLSWNIVILLLPQQWSICYHLTER